MLEKIAIFREDVKEKGLYRSITHRIYKHHSLKPLAMVANVFKPNVVYVNGMRMIIDKNDVVVSESIMLKKVWSRPETDLIKRHLKKGDVFVDVGAHIGYFTLLAAKIVGSKGHVYAFEPGPKNFDLLVQNVKLNNLDNVTCINSAVTDQRKTVDFYVNNHNTGDNRLSKPGEKTKAIKVQTTTLDSSVRRKQVDFIKLDIQGAEGLALSGASKVLNRNRKIKILLEFWPKALRETGTESKDFFKILRSIFKMIKFVDGRKVNTYKSIVSEISGSCGAVNLFCTH